MVGTKEVFTAYYVKFGYKVKVIVNIFGLDYTSDEHDW